MAQKRRSRIKSGDDGEEHTYMGYVTRFSAPSIALELKEERANVEYDIDWDNNRRGSSYTSSSLAGASGMADQVRHDGVGDDERTVML